MYSAEHELAWTRWELTGISVENNQALEVCALGSEIVVQSEINRRQFLPDQKIDFILDNLTDGLFILDTHWKFVQVNKTFEEIVAIPRHLLLGRKIWDFFPDNDQYNYPAAFRNAMQYGETVRFVDYRADLNKWFSASAYPTAEGLAVHFKDITE
jgi:PAS domain S-box-containing protein